jgi:hypothetical protein
MMCCGGDLLVFILLGVHGTSWRLIFGKISANIYSDILFPLL